MIYNIFTKNQLPKAETLTRISRAENVDINWLLTGQGSPHLVDWQSLPGLGDEAQSADAEGSDWTSYYVCDDAGHAAALVLTRPREETPSNAPAYNWTEIKIKPQFDYQQLSQIDKLYVVEIPVEDFNKLISGYLGMPRIKELILDGEHRLWDHKKSRDYKPDKTATLAKRIALVKKEHRDMIEALLESAESQKKSKG